MDGPRCPAPVAPSLAVTAPEALPLLALHSLAGAAAVATLAPRVRPSCSARRSRCRGRARTHLRCKHVEPSAPVAAAAPAAAPSLPAEVLQVLALD